MNQNLIKLQAQHVNFGYGKKIILKNLSFELHAGEILTLIGANGAGKSTILKTIAKQLRTVSGVMYLNQKNLQKIPEKALARELSVFLTQRIDPELMTCEDVVASGRYPYTGRLGILSEQDKQKIQEALELVHALEFRQTAFHQISDGQRQRIMLARAVCQEPEVLLLDEPTSFLDLKHKLELLALIQKLTREKQIAVMLSLHELDLAQKVSDRILCVSGDVCRIGTPEEIFTDQNIRDLYQIQSGSYSVLTGSPELARPEGEPEIFVIGGAGSGIPVYHQLQRKHIPFAAGVLHLHDLDYPSASALAMQVITEQDFEPISDLKINQALQIMQTCRSVICTVKQFGSMNAGNQILLKKAIETGKLTEI
ncbi:MAG: ABC transporter ATP-binding protein [Oscillospiraceae bacterium]|nr:ABC transporter ATP-binding protein [Oscillospiraceae bacterium]